MEPGAPGLLSSAHLAASSPDGSVGEGEVRRVCAVSECVWVRSDPGAHVWSISVSSLL